MKLRQNKCKAGRKSTNAAFSNISVSPGICLNPPAAVKVTSPSAPSKTLHWTCSKMATT